MNTKIIIAILLIVAAVGYGAMSFVETNVQYTDFQTAQSNHRKVQVKGEWIRNKETSYDGSRNEFTFYMRDDSGVETKVIFEGAKPNNFELANALVIKGRFQDNTFRASDILTKCPSKYEVDNKTENK
ncbi:MAG: cytochrome c maturation protein CcmE [Bacteroidota bacterium]